ncbi:hypothetical protein GDO81_025590 [Engystomops pustulosus]|uniref:Uncharacterized protein n=1 Tax=Engystomops pustulosus TaxID=76066 RepID=A0AAV6YL77_ENGPU|nr:hypothetical protein GDO81_025590 [Engystomops pustulosus]
MTFLGAVYYTISSSISMSPLNLWNFLLGYIHTAVARPYRTGQRQCTGRGGGGERSSPPPLSIGIHGARRRITGKDRTGPFSRVRSGTVPHVCCTVPLP